MEDDYNDTSGAPPPAYTEMTDDGRIDINFNSSLAKALAKCTPPPPQHVPKPPSADRKTPPKSFHTRLNIVIQVVGSRGDVQPFLALAQELQSHGHRMRIATHACFRAFIEASNIEFFPIGGDPHDLMAYMVKNPGLIPSMKALRAGDIQKKRKMVAEMLDGCWRSCVEPSEVDGRPFVADAIIANPPAFAHVHCAQALGVPLHLVFTMPWSCTRAFAHPLANLDGAQLDPGVLNWVSFGVVEWMTWQGLGDVINSFREGLDLERIPATVGPSLADALKIPFTYCWSPALIPKPADWGEHIDVCGFIFRDAPSYSPSPEIADFLRADPPPVYIGFGSIVIEDPARMTDLILEAVRMCGVRAIISRGWAKLGSNPTAHGEKCRDVLFIDDCPHEWLFQHVSAVVHHGGAGTTACGLRNACPTFIVPFFGDQPFWGAMIASADAGPFPISHQLLTATNLAAGITFCQQHSTISAAKEIAKKMSTENGVKEAVASFYANLPLERLTCQVLKDRPATWMYGKGKVGVRLSALAAGILLDQYKISRKDLTLFQTSPITIPHERWDPVTSITSSGLSTMRGMTTSATSLILAPYSASKTSSTPLAATSNSLLTISKSFAKFNAHLFKGIIVDLPLAATEGFRAVPRLYGEDVQSHGQVTGVASGFSVAGKSFKHGIVGGVEDLFVKPARDAKRDGVKGFVVGVGTGTVGFSSKVAGAVVGLVAYPGEGICRELRGLAGKGVGKMVAARRVEEGVWEMDRGMVDKRVVEEVLGVWGGLIGEY